jgi:RNA polymerase sigma factor for flagellar operon FliA
MNAKVHTAGNLENGEGAQQLLTEQLSQVRYLARQIHERLPRHVPLEDLVNAGVIGLIDAIHKFDPQKHVQFRSYAKFRIRGAILDSLREMDWGPRTLRRQARRLAEAHHRLSTTLGRAPTEPEMAKKLGIELHEFQLLLGELKGLELSSLTNELQSDGRTENLGDRLPGAPEDSPFHACLRSEMRSLLRRLLDELPEKDRQTLALYYFEGKTMQEIGNALGISESRVSQIHSTAVSRLRARLQQLMNSQAAESKRRAAVATS